jgi:hypothetical protein
MELLPRLLLSSLAVLVGLGLAYAGRRGRRPAWLRTTGTIVSAQFRWVEGGMAIAVSYHYSVAGETYTGTFERHLSLSLEAREEAAAAMRQFAVGAATPVVYNSRRPEESGLGHRPASWTLALEWSGWALAGFGVLALIAAVLSLAG